MENLIEKIKSDSEKSRFEITIEFVTDQIAHGLGKKYLFVALFEKISC